MNGKPMEVTWGLAEGVEWPTRTGRRSTRALLAFCPPGFHPVIHPAVETADGLEMRVTYEVVPGFFDEGLEITYGVVGAPEAK